LKPFLQNIFQFGEDSRLKGHCGRVTHAVLPLERTFCANCGRPWGWASEDSSEHIAAAEIVVFCEDCFAALNANQQVAPSSRIPETEMRSLGLLEEHFR
jgi:hypothetical protein